MNTLVAVPVSEFTSFLLNNMKDLLAQAKADPSRMRGFFLASVENAYPDDVHHPIGSQPWYVQRLALATISITIDTLITQMEGAPPEKIVAFIELMEKEVEGALARRNP